MTHSLRIKELTFPHSVCRYAVDPGMTVRHSETAFTLPAWWTKDKFLKISCIFLCLGPYAGRTPFPFPSLIFFSLHHWWTNKFLLFVLLFVWSTMVKEKRWEGKDCCHIIPGPLTSRSFLRDIGDVGQEFNVAAVKRHPPQFMGHFLFLSSFTCSGPWIHWWMNVSTFLFSLTLCVIPTSKFLNLLYLYELVGITQSESKEKKGVQKFLLFIFSFSRPHVLILYIYILGREKKNEKWTSGWQSIRVAVILARVSSSYFLSQDHWLSIKFLIFFSYSFCGGERKFLSYYNLYMRVLPQNE